MKTVLLYLVGWNMNEIINPDAHIERMKKEIDRLTSENKWLRYLASRHLGMGFDLPEGCSGCDENIKSYKTI